MSSPVPQRSGCMSLWYKYPVGMVLLVACIGLCLLYAIINFGPSLSGAPNNQSQVSGTPTETPTLGLTATPTIKPTPTHVPQWTTVQSFNGTGSKKTDTFTVPDKWRIVWSCDPSSYDIPYNVIAQVYSPDGKFVDGAVSTTCKAGNTTDTAQEYTGGTFYLDITSEGDWTIQVQVLK